MSGAAVVVLDARVQGEMVEHGAVDWSTHVHRALICVVVSLIFCLLHVLKEELSVATKIGTSAARGKIQSR